MEITAVSIAAQLDSENAEERERRYEEITSKMEPEILSSYARMFALLYLATVNMRMILVIFLVISIISFV